MGQELEAAEAPGAGSILDSHRSVSREAAVAPGEEVVNDRCGDQFSSCFMLTSMLCGDCTEATRRRGEGAFFLIFYVSWTMARNSRPRHWTPGPTGARSDSIFRVGADRVTMPPSRPSTAWSDESAFRNTGFKVWRHPCSGPRRARSSQIGCISKGVRRHRNNYRDGYTVKRSEEYPLCVENGRFSEARI